MLAPVDLVTDRFKEFVSRFKEFRPYQLETARGITDEEVADVIHEVCSENIIPI